MESALEGHEFLKERVLREIKAFAGSTRAMIQVRFRESITLALDELIEDGLVVVREKRVEGRRLPVRVLYVDDVDDEKGFDGLPELEPVNDDY